MNTMNIQKCAHCGISKEWVSAINLNYFCSFTCEKTWRRKKHNEDEKSRILKYCPWRLKPFSEWPEEAKKGYGYVKIRPGAGDIA